MVIRVTTPDQNAGTSEIILAQNLDDRTILRAMAESIQDGILNTRDAIAGTIAELLLQENRTNEVGLVLPTTGIIERTIKPNPTETIPPDSLVGLTIKINDSRSPREQAELGIELGDKAVLMHAGFVGSRNLGDTRSTQQYAHSMGIAGYQQAIAYYLSYPNSRGYAANLQTTAFNFERVSRIIRTLNEKGIKPVATN